MKKFLVGIGALIAILVVVVISVVVWWGSTYNGLVRKDQAVNASWGQVENVYQRRTDLIPNLVATVKGYASHEKDTFVEVTQARQTQVNVSDSALKDAQKETGPDAAAHQAAAQQQYIAAQQGLTQALGGLKIVMEKYPDLKANENFLALQSQLEGTENRITVERQNNQMAVQDYNTSVQGFLSGIVAKHYGYVTKPYFEAQAGSNVAPTVNFGK